MEEIENTLLTIIDSVNGRISSEQAQNIREFTTAGEPGVALEILCDNLDDDSIAITTDTLSLIRTIGQAMGMDSDYWERLIIQEQ